MIMHNIFYNKILLIWVITTYTLRKYKFISTLNIIIIIIQFKNIYHSEVVNKHAKLNVISGSGVYFKS